MRNFCIVSLFVLFSCADNVGDDIIASVDDSELFLSDVLREMPSNIEDSAYFVQYYMDKWIREKLMLYHAELNLSIDMKDYEKQIDEYRSSLLIYAYQQQLLNQNFDTMISNQSIVDYYNQYQDEFRLNSSVFKGRYIVVNKSAPRLSSLSVWYKSNKDEDILELEDYCKQFAQEYYLADSNWQYFSLINNDLPDQIGDDVTFLRNNKSLYLEGKDFRYYIYIKDYKIKGNISPLGLEKEKIRNVLLNKNKINYLSKLEDELYQNGLALDKIKMYK
tara:strand:- start:8294 stop:9121 length:828 start_codon:yes stop_codon:yes gene_type:complete